MLRPSARNKPGKRRREFGSVRKPEQFFSGQRGGRRIAHTSCPEAGLSAGNQSNRVESGGRGSSFMEPDKTTGSRFLPSNKRRNSSAEDLKEMGTGLVRGPGLLGVLVPALRRHCLALRLLMFSESIAFVFVVLLLCVVSFVVVRSIAPIRRNRESNRLRLCGQRGRSKTYRQARVLFIDPTRDQGLVLQVSSAGGPRRRRLFVAIPA